MITVNEFLNDSHMITEYSKNFKTLNKFAVQLALFSLF